MGFFSKLLRTVNHVDAKVKDVKMVGNLTSGKTDKAVRRAKTKVKSKAANKVFKSLKF